LALGRGLTWEENFWGGAEGLLMAPVKRGEIFSEWARPGAVSDLKTEPFTECVQCAREPFRVMVIETDGGQRRGVSVCGNHFEEATNLLTRFV
jgi:hypothetical protein